jgi:hypothetical protein
MNKLDPARAQLPAAQGRKLVSLAAALTGVGLVGGAIASLSDTTRFAHAYLTGFVFVITLGVGALLFLAIQHVTRAGWSVPVRRPMEWLATSLPLGALLFVPVAALAPRLYHHWMHGAPDDAKHRFFLNPWLFIARAAIYFAVWSLLARFFHRESRRQDETGDHAHTLRMQRRSAPAILLIAITLTFAGFDWLMSLDPHWYSTIFGVYVFAGSMTGALSVLALVLLAMEKSGVGAATVEHRHDVGKLLFGFTVFWAYIAFSQYFLIWYANIPEETIFYLRRWEGGWQGASVALVVGHFALPFVLLLSRTAKRSALVLGVTAALMLAMHWLDVWWLVMPNLEGSGGKPSLIDLAGLLPPVGVVALWLAIRASREPALPLRDPRLAEALGLENP